MTMFGTPSIVAASSRAQVPSAFWKPGALSELLVRLCKLVYLTNFKPHSLSDCQLFQPP